RFGNDTVAGSKEQAAWWQATMTAVKGGQVRLQLTMQHNNIEGTHKDGMLVQTNGFTLVQQVQPGKAVKVVLEKYPKGTARKWVEVTVHEGTPDKVARPAAGPAPKPQGQPNAAMPQGAGAQVIIRVPNCVVAPGAGVDFGFPVQRVPEDRAKEFNFWVGLFR